MSLLSRNEVGFCDFAESPSDGPRSDFLEDEGEDEYY
jgi:hypothetical protein